MPTPTCWGNVGLMVHSWLKSISPLRLPLNSWKKTLERQIKGSIRMTLYMTQILTIGESDNLGIVNSKEQAESIRQYFGLISYPIKLK